MPIYPDHREIIEFGVAIIQRMAARTCDPRLLTGATLHAFFIHCIGHLSLVDPEVIQADTVDRLCIRVEIASHDEFAFRHEHQGRAVLSDHARANAWGECYGYNGWLSDH